MSKGDHGMMICNGLIPSMLNCSGKACRHPRLRLPALPFFAKKQAVEAVATGRCDLYVNAVSRCTQLVLYK